MTQPAIDPQDGFGLVRSFSRHVQYVRLALTMVQHNLEVRGLSHDLSKLKDDEFAGFSRINAAARVNKFGSPEYKAGMDAERGTINTHFGRNSHHPEYYAEHPDHLVNHGRDCTTACGMTFLDVIEMVCDWWGARAGYDDPRPWMESVELNFKAKGKYLTPEQQWLARDVASFLEHQGAP